jgi:hypothetical protein
MASTTEIKLLSGCIALDLLGDGLYIKTGNSNALSNVKKTGGAEAYFLMSYYVLQRN